jgi:hypothetical protein
MLMGGILGALGAGGMARGYNMAQGEAGSGLRWSEDFVRGLLRSSLLRYLAVAHYGRGRGDYSESEHPTFWQSAVAGLMEARRAEIARVWEQGRSGDAAAFLPTLEPLLRDCAARLLVQFYPEAHDLLAGEIRQSRAIDASGA